MLYDDTQVDSVFINSGGIDNTVLVKPTDGSWPNGRTVLLRQIKTAEQLDK